MAWLSCPVPPTTKAAGGGGGCFPPCLFQCGRGQLGQHWHQKKGRLAGWDSKIRLWVPVALKPTHPHPGLWAPWALLLTPRAKPPPPPWPKEGSCVLGGGGEHQGLPLPLKAAWRGSPSTTFFSIHLRGERRRLSSRPLFTARLLPWTQLLPRKGSHRCRKGETPPPAQHHWAAT